MLNLDTHILIDALGTGLSPREKTLLAKSRWSVSGMVFWEIAKLLQRGRIEFDFEDPAISNILSWLKVWPVDPEVAIASMRLDFASDPADELIAATSVVHRVPLLTRDRVIRRSKVVPLAQ